MVPTAGRGIAGHTVLGTAQALPAGGLPGTLPGGPLGGGLGEPQACSACNAESQPGNTTSPASVQVGCVDSAQRRYASPSDVQDATESAIAQAVVQSVPRSAEAHPARAMLSHVAEHDAAIWAGEQLLPQVASGPASPSWLLTAPPHPTTAHRPTHAATQRMSRTPTAQLWPHSREAVNGAVRGRNDTA